MFESVHVSNGRMSPITKRIGCVSMCEINPIFIDWSHTNRYACTNKMSYDAFMPKLWPLITDISFRCPLYYGLSACTFPLFLLHYLSLALSTRANESWELVIHAKDSLFVQIDRLVYINNSSNISLSLQINFKLFHLGICPSIGLVCSFVFHIGLVLQRKVK